MFATLTIHCAETSQSENTTLTFSEVRSKINREFSGISNEVKDKQRPSDNVSNVIQEIVSAIQSLSVSDRTIENYQNLVFTLLRNIFVSSGMPGIHNPQKQKRTAQLYITDALDIAYPALEKIKNIEPNVFVDIHAPNIAKEIVDPIDRWTKEYAIWLTPEQAQQLFQYNQTWSNIVAMFDPVTWHVSVPKVDEAEPRQATPVSELKNIKNTVMMETINAWKHRINGTPYYLMLPMIEQSPQKYFSTQNGGHVYLDHVLTADLAASKNDTESHNRFMEQKIDVTQRILSKNPDLMHLPNDFPTPVHTFTDFLTGLSGWGAYTPHKEDVYRMLDILVQYGGIPYFTQSGPPDPDAKKDEYMIPIEESDLVRSYYISRQLTDVYHALNHLRQATS